MIRDNTKIKLRKVDNYYRMLHTTRYITVGEPFTSKKKLQEYVDKLVKFFVNKLEDNKIIEIDIKVLFNGIECEPKFLKMILDNVEKYIDDEAKIVANKKFKEMFEIINGFSDMFHDFEYKVRDKFNIYEESEN